jgi:hypothetical protein
VRVVAAVLVAVPRQAVVVPVGPAVLEELQVPQIRVVEAVEATNASTVLADQEVLAS